MTDYAAVDEGSYSDGLTAGRTRIGCRNDSHSRWRWTAWRALVGLAYRWIATSERPRVATPQEEPAEILAVAVRDRVAGPDGEAGTARDRREHGKRTCHLTDSHPEQADGVVRPHGFIALLSRQDCILQLHYRMTSTEGERVPRGFMRRGSDSKNAVTGRARPPSDSVASALLPSTGRGVTYRMRVSSSLLDQVRIACIASSIPASWNLTQ